MCVGGGGGAGGGGGGANSDGSTARSNPKTKAPWTAATTICNCCLSCCAEQSHKDNVRSTAVEKQLKQKKSSFLSPASPPCS